MAISAIILAGGRATRMSGVDKGLVNFQEKPLIAHVIARLSPQVDEILINANRELSTYQSLGYPVLQDETESFPGPLAGFLLGLKHAQHPWILTAPCDSPLLPLDLAKKLYEGMASSNADIVVATCNGETHPVFCLMKKSLYPSLKAFMDAGERKVSKWQKSQHYAEVDFTGCAQAFTNLNTLEELQVLESSL